MLLASVKESGRDMKKRERITTLTHVAVTASMNSGTVESTSDERAAATETNCLGLDPDFGRSSQNDIKKGRQLRYGSGSWRVNGHRAEVGSGN